ncbi:hypothetical protein AK812_SmicGene11507 [Symbiodinium microadriaticum]|uniref:Uncharacterized protein n=1 Tax=Symbiodinium microadriaticum TaxID=2951 RepID=A0A1Q9ED24_SYMMI|nr:hypothetical protein AK812_SmicGene11507 [Symbiodinium microadriaticum]
MRKSTIGRPPAHLFVGVQLQGAGGCSVAPMLTEGNLSATSAQAEIQAVAEEAAELEAQLQAVAESEITALAEEDTPLPAPKKKRKKKIARLGKRITLVALD